MAPVAHCQVRRPKVLHRPRVLRRPRAQAQPRVLPQSRVPPRPKRFRQSSHQWILRPSQAVSPFPQTPSETRMRASCTRQSNTSATNTPPTPTRRLRSRTKRPLSPAQDRRVVQSWILHTIIRTAWASKMMSMTLLSSLWTTALLRKASILLPSGY